MEARKIIVKQLNLFEPVLIGESEMYKAVPGDKVFSIAMFHS